MSDNKTSTLANAELGIMELLWKEKSLTARQIREELYPDAKTAQHGTVQRLLQRLEEKGFVQRDARPAGSAFFGPDFAPGVCGFADGIPGPEVDGGLAGASHYALCGGAQNLERGNPALEESPG